MPTGGGAPRPNPPQPPRPAPAAPWAHGTEATAAPFAYRSGIPNVTLQANLSGNIGDPLSELASMMQEDSPPAEPEEPHEVDRHIAGDITYVMFSDGAVEVQTRDGAQRFASLQALREAAAAQGIDAHEGRAVGGKPAGARRVISRAAKRSPCFLSRSACNATARSFFSARMAAGISHFGSRLRNPSSFRANSAEIASASAP